MWEAARRVREHAVVGRVHLARVRSAFARIDWLAADAAVRARDSVAATLHDFLAGCLALADAIAYPPAVVLRQLAAHAPADVLPVHRLLWAAMPAPDGCDFAAWAAFVDRRARRHGVRLPLVGLFAATPRVRRCDAAWLLAGPPRVRFLMLLLHGRRAGMLGRSVRHCDDVDPARLAAWTVEAWAAWRLPRLSRGQFDRLPARFRRALLARESAGAMLRFANADHPDAPPQRARSAERTTAALEAIRRRDFAYADLADVLRDPDDRPPPDRLADAVRSPTADARWTPPAGGLADAVDGLPPGPCRAYLALLLLPPAERAALSPIRLAAVADWWTPADWLATFAASDEAGRRRLPPLGRRALVDAADAVPDRAAVGTLGGHLAALPRARRLGAWLCERPWLVGEALAGIALGYLARRFRADGPAGVLAALSPPLAAALWDAEPGRFGGLLREIVARVLRDADDSLAQLLGVLPSAARADAIPDPLTPKGFTRLLAGWPDTPPARFRVVEDARTGRPAWLLALIRLRKARTPVPAPLRALFDTAPPGSRRLAFRAYPAAFAADSPTLPIRELLTAAFACPVTAGIVEEGVPRDVLVAELPWVREQYAHAPSIAAALELAVRFSLRDARFLCQLARRVVPPTDPTLRGRQFDELYTVSERPKRSGGVRVITAPVPRLKRLQRRLLANGFAAVPLHDAAHGFRAGRSVRTNAEPHAGRPLVVNLDIRGFFPGTPYPLILRACRTLADGQLSPRAVFLLADLCAYGGALPTGAPTSPAIGNIVLTPADRAIAAAAERCGAAYTRYADDLTLSGPPTCKRLIPFVERVLAGLGYALDPRKTNLYRPGRRQVVTGLVVNVKPSWPRHLRRLLRAAVDRRARGGVPMWEGEPASDARLLGLIAFLRVTRPEEAAELRTRLAGCTS